MRSADVVLMLDDGVAILCHSQILSLHSAVIRGMLAELPAGQHDDPINIPLVDFTEAQCSALLSYLYSNGVSSEAAAFAKHINAASVVARFAHTYDVPHAMWQVQAHLIDIIDTKWRIKLGDLTENVAAFDRGLNNNSAKTMVDWALMADRFDTHKLCGHCEQLMMMYWESFQDRPDLVDQLSRGALRRIAKGLNTTLLASERQAKKRSLLLRMTSLYGGKKRQPAAHHSGTPARQTLKVLRVSESPGKFLPCCYSCMIDIARACLGGSAGQQLNKIMPV